MKQGWRWRSASMLRAAALVALAVPAHGAAPIRDAWPRTIRMGQTIVTLDAPQAESLEGSHLTARGGFRIQRPQDAAPSSGTLRYAAQVALDRIGRTVTFSEVEIAKVDLPGAPPARRRGLAMRLSRRLSGLPRPLRLSLDDVLAQVRATGLEPASSPRFDNRPPRILFSSVPAVLVIFDGAPRFRAVEGTGLERALNTPFLVLRDPRAGAYWLDGGTEWFRAADPEGPWAKASAPPAGAVRIARRDLEEAGVSPGPAKDAGEAADGRTPQILVATAPTELVVSDGAPRWSALVPGALETMANSQSDVFRTLPDGRYWVVLSGRWYRAASLDGPWSYVEPGRLPGAFRRIPSDSPRAGVLAFVPGTAAARAAVADATRPRTAAIRRSQASLAVTYDGDPKFEAIAGTEVSYALNSPQQVLLIRGRYYACDQGVWFTSGSPAGPWLVADAIPEADIQRIPPDSPVYDTRFVYVYDATPDVVYVAYTPAYLGSYPYDGTVVFGTGWLYRPWWGAYYYPRPWTWGFHAVYAPWVGWGWGFGWGPAWAGFRLGFGFGWGAAWCGPGAFYRPALWNAAVARNVTVNRSANITRNVYASGANVSRGATLQGSTARGAAGATVAGRGAGAPAVGGRQAASRAGGISPGAAGGRGGVVPRNTKARPMARKGGARVHGRAARGGGRKH